MIVQISNRNNYAFISVQASENPNSDVEEDLQSLLSKTFKSFAASFERTILENGNKDTIEAILKAEKRLKVLTNPNLLNSSLHTFGTTVGRGGWGKIPVQATSRMRRQEGTHRGKAVVQRGRKAKLAARKVGKKRAHNLAACVRANVAVGKSHNSTMF